MTAATEVSESYESTDLTRTFAVDGVELAWDRWGADAGVPLVLGHGYSGSTQDFAPVIAALAAGRPIIAYARRGHGASTSTGDPATYTIDKLVADEIAFLEANGGGPVDLLGHSMGGRVAAQVAIERPDLLRSLILMDTSAWSFRAIDPDMVALITAFLTDFDPSGGLPNMDAMRGPEDDLIEARLPAELAARRTAAQAAFDPVALHQLGQELFLNLTSLRPRLGEIAVPVTVVVGSNDSPLVEQAPDLAAEVADGTLVVIDGAYHSPQLTHRAEWLAAIEDHLGRAATAN
jgi:pimeloyl-ACP methyl ester carboxylesterase